MLNKTTCYLRRATKEEADAVFEKQALLNDYTRIERHTESILSINYREVSVSFLKAFHAAGTANRNRFVELTWDEEGETQSVQGHMWIELDSGAGAPERINLITPISVGDAQIVSFLWNETIRAYDAVDQNGTVYTKPAESIQ